MAKYHIKKDGLPGICKAKVRPCPRGGSCQHFNNIDQMNLAIDKMNGRAVSGTFAFGVVDGKLAMEDSTKETIRHMTSAQINIKKIENTISAMKEQIRIAMVDANIQSLKTQYGTLSAKDASERRTIDIEKLKANGIYADYLKEIDVRGHVSFYLVDDEDGSKMEKLTKPASFKLGFDASDIIVDEKGNATLSERGEKIIKSIRNLDISTKNLAEAHKK